jgi:hypothetical protein
LAGIDAGFDDAGVEGHAVDDGEDSFVLGLVKCFGSDSFIDSVAGWSCG